MVDDEPEVLRFMGRVLADAGYLVHVAPSPQAAIDLLARMDTPPAALVSDLRMQPLDGVDIAKHILHKWPETRVLLVSGWAPDHLGREWPFLQKPFSPERLVEALGNLLAGQSRFQEDD